MPTNVEIARRGYEAALAGDLETVRGFLAPVIIRPIADGGEPGEPSANLTTFRDGKAIEMVHYPDPADALAAIG